MSNTEIATFDNVNDEFAANALDRSIAVLKSGGTDIFSTFDGTDFDTQLDVVDAVSSALPLADNLGTVINLKNVVIQPIEMKDENSGEMVRVPRIILVDVDGTAYAAISTGIMKSLQNYFGLLGFPKDWPRPLSVVAKEARSRANFRFMTLALHREDKVAAKK